MYILITNFSLLQNVQTGSGAHPASYSIGMGKGAHSLGVKQPGYEGDNSPPSNAEVKNERIYTSTLLYAFMAWIGTNLPLPFTLTLLQTDGAERIQYCRSCRPFL